jgi:hypothetical protein
MAEGEETGMKKPYEKPEIISSDYSPEVFLAAACWNKNNRTVSGGCTTLSTKSKSTKCCHVLDMKFKNENISSS